MQEGGRGVLTHDAEVVGMVEAEAEYRERELILMKAGMRVLISVRRKGKVA